MSSPRTPKPRYTAPLPTFEKLNGSVEADETYIGGLEKNKHENKKLKAGRGAVGKSIVIAVLERSPSAKKSKVRTKIAPDTGRETLHTLLKSNVESGSNIYTDAHKGYNGLSEEFVHEFIDHAVCYAQGAVHTNGLENYFSLLKRTLRGTYISVEPFHLTKYIDEQAYRFNHRDLNDAERFLCALNMVTGSRLTYEELTNASERYFRQAIP